MSYQDVPEIALEHRREILPLAVAVIIFSIAVSAWASALGEHLIVTFVTLIAGAVLAALIFLEPFLGLCIMALLIPVEEIYAFAGGWLTGTKAVGIVTFAGALANAQIRARALRFDKQSRWILAFAFWIGLSFVWSYGRLRMPHFMVLTAAQLALFWVLIRACVVTQYELRAVSVCFITGTVLAIVASVIAPRWGIAPRLIYTTGNPNILARDIVASLVLLIYHGAAARPWGKLAAVGTGGFLLSALALTQSRAGWIAALASLPIVVYGNRRAFGPAGVAAMAFIAVVIFNMQLLSAHLGVTEAGLEQRWESMFAGSEIRTSRLDIWRAGIILGTRNPILGVGMGQFPEAVNPVLDEHASLLAYRRIGAHNSFISVFAELGIVGLVLLMVILCQCVRGVSQAPASPAKAAAWALLVATFVRMMFMDAQYQKTIWYSLALTQIITTIRPPQREPDDDAALPGDGAED